jgi:hypothetical protein
LFEIIKKKRLEMRKVETDEKQSHEQIIEKLKFSKCRQFVTAVLNEKFH